MFLGRLLPAVAVVSKWLELLNNGKAKDKEQKRWHGFWTLQPCVSKLLYVDRIGCCSRNIPVGLWNAPSPSISARW